MTTPIAAGFCAGTSILTDRGETLVEALGVADHVVTASAQPRRVKWLGWRRYPGRVLAGRADILPICFTPGSLAPDMPWRNLWVSPKHAIFLDGLLIPAERLVNGNSIVQARRVNSVAYFHVELDSHDVLLAEGTPVESYAGDGGRGEFQNAFEYAELYPGEPPRTPLFCAPRVESGDDLARIRWRIAARAKMAVEV